MALRIRGEETTMRVTIDGQEQQGSWLKVENFKWNAAMDHAWGDFIGEPTSEPDLQHHGFEFSFGLQHLDPSVNDYTTKLVDQLNAGALLPNMVLTFIKKYRDPSIQPETLTFSGATLKPDGEDSGSRKDYIKTTFSGRSSNMIRAVG